jgi:hypothetical protein
MVRKCGGTMLRKRTDRKFRGSVEVVTGSVEVAVNQENIEGTYNSRWVRPRTEALFLIAPS